MCLAVSTYLQWIFLLIYKDTVFIHNNNEIIIVIITIIIIIIIIFFNYLLLLLFIYLSLTSNLQDNIAKIIKLIYVTNY